MWRQDWQCPTAIVEKTPAGFDPFSIFDPDFNPNAPRTKKGWPYHRLLNRIIVKSNAIGSLSLATLSVRSAISIFHPRTFRMVCDWATQKGLMHEFSIRVV
jgi:hypothetical protein